MLTTRTGSPSSSLPLDGQPLGNGWPPGEAAKACLDAEGGEGCSISYSFTDFARLIGPQQTEPCVAVPHAAGSRAAQPDGAVPSAERVSVAAALASDGSGSDWGGRFDRMALEFLSWEAAAHRCRTLAQTP